jgi:hypothetical protein
MLSRSFFPIAQLSKKELPIKFILMGIIFPIDIVEFNLYNVLGGLKGKLCFGGNYLSNCHF